MYYQRRGRPERGARRELERHNLRSSLRHGWWQFVLQLRSYSTPDAFVIIFGRVLPQYIILQGPLNQKYLIWKNSNIIFWTSNGLEHVHPLVIKLKHLFLAIKQMDIEHQTYKNQSRDLQNYSSNRFECYFLENQT